MTEQSRERLYNLLPTVYRTRDVEQGEPLRALLAGIETEYDRIERDIDGSYRNEFIETCDTWVVPYIADLLGIRDLQMIEGEGLPGLRAYVANTLAYRRRKGTAGVLEQLAWDVAGWRACVVEFFQLLSGTQHTNHPRPGAGGTADLRSTSVRDHVNGPFEETAHTVEMRRAGAGGRYRIPTVGLSVWRLQSYPVADAEARSVSTKDTPTDPEIWRGFSFNPLGLDAQLFNPAPRSEPELAHIADEINLPCALRRRALLDTLEAWRQALVDEAAPDTSWFDENPAFEITVDGSAIPPEQIAVCDLRNWRKPAPGSFYAPTGNPHCVGMPSGTCPIERPIRAAVDPELGRITFADPQPDDDGLVIDETTVVRVSYAYGFGGDVGAGPYDRHRSVESWLPNEPNKVTWQVGVTQDKALRDQAAVGELFPSVQAAVDAWNTHVDLQSEEFGVIAIMDSSSYADSLVGSHTVEVPPKCTLAIVAADWPVGEEDKREKGRLAPDGLLPHIASDISVHELTDEQIAGLPAESDLGELILDGLLIEGQITVRAGDLGRLTVNHCTVHPSGKALRVNSSSAASRTNDRLSVHVERSIAGWIDIPEHISELHSAESIVIGAGEDDVAVLAPNAPTIIQGGTILGTCDARSLEASDAIFERRLTVERTQVGCVRFSYVPDDESTPSRTPRRYRCQPDLALAAGSDLSEDEKRLVRSQVSPSFTSRRYGAAGFAQLASHCAEEIRTGAESGSEMGAFSHLMQPQREANLRAALRDYLPFGLEIALDYET